MKLKKHLFSACLATTITCGTLSTPAYALDPLIGQVIMFAGNFCPRGFAKAEGQLLSISQNQALYSILGTTYGGDGSTTFALPDFRGRSVVGPGTGPGLSTYRLGQKSGVETQPIQVQNMPAHRHTVNATNTIADKGGPGGKRLAAMGNAGSTGPFVYSEAAANRTMAEDTISLTGSGAPLNVRAPSIALQSCIAITGIYPSRN